MQELTEHTAKLDEQVASEKRLNEQLHGKIAELQEAKSAMRSKLQSYAGSEPRAEPARPTPAPRTNLQPAVHALQADNERLEAEKKDLQKQLDRVSWLRTTIEEQFQQSSQKVQGIVQEKYQLQRQLETKNSQISEQQRAYQSLEQEFERVRREKDQMLASNRGRKVDRERELKYYKGRKKSYIVKWRTWRWSMLMHNIVVESIQSSPLTYHQYA